MKIPALTKALLLLSFSIAMTSCQTQTAKKNNLRPTTENATANVDSTNTDTSSVNKEFLPVNEMRICGKLPMESNVQKLKALLGKPDSIITPDMNNICTSFYERKFEQYYAKGVSFEKYGDTVVFSGIDFTRDPNTFLSFDEVRLDGKTNITDIKKMFPAAGAEVSDVKTADGNYSGLRLALSKTMSDDSLLLLFDKRTGMLKSLQYYMPC
ncbi:hypothetical protein LT679_12510 [Mucilaginibacter roseus]|uniref:Beta-lactamase-inhibitor-like PepSY-like domain-containing protein n=1 Tax=Mucilaginibacter roseus TaxID=1528868 RepID=A0ABS8U2R3_9SPHI|nr:hypothetical protein [Mucilaginibacter roseus]MCD8741430.1 hypothetical protein [Mucilaginibacter roseus]